MKGSHKFPLNIRGAGIPSKYGSHFSDAKKYLTPIKVKVGEALLFDSRLLHYSPPNYSRKSRTAIINNIIPTDAQTRCLHGKGDGNELDVNHYDVPEDFFIHYEAFNAQKDFPNPKGVLIEKINYGNIKTPSQEEFQRLIKKYKIKKKSFFNLF